MRVWIGLLLLLLGNVCASTARSRLVFQAHLDDGSISGEDMSTGWTAGGSDGWMPAVVPGTVLATMVHNGLHPDPYTDDNLALIPDINDVGAAAYTYYFRSVFQVDSMSGRVFVHFNGINYRAQVFVNGVQLSPVLEGMFLRHRLDITDVAQEGDNYLVVLVLPSDNYGAPGGQGGNGTIARDVTAQYSAGWDWVASSPDRMTGIWDVVEVEVANNVRAEQVHVVTLVHADGAATVDVSFDVVNDGTSAYSSNVTLTVTDAFGVVQFAVDNHIDNLSGGESLNMHVTHEWANPQLWWPLGYGQQPLYNAAVYLHQNTGSEPQSVTVRFGVRQVSSEIMTVGAGDMDGRVFLVNGRRVFIRGGNWIGTDMLMRYQADGKRYRDEVRMHREMGMNLIRIWGGGIMERPEFYDACDEMGVLVMQEFWMTGDANGLWNGQHDYPLNHDLFIDSVRDSILMLRNHPSLLFWCGGNELAPVGLSPPEDIRSATQALVDDIDGTRLYLPSSMNSNLTQFDNDIVLAPYDGPYGLQTPSFFFQRQANKVVINPEVGNVGVPVYESLQRFMSPTHLEQFPSAAADADGDVHNVDPVWAFHKYIKYAEVANDNDTDHLYAYGTPRDTSEFALQAQLVNYDQYRAIVEGYQAHMWEYHTGVILWKSQNPWPGLRGSAYDWYLEQNGAFYGMRVAAEVMHVQMYEPDWSTQVVNSGFDELVNASVSRLLFDKHGVVYQVDTVAVPLVSPSSVLSLQDATTWPSELDESATLFIQLQLRDASHMLVSRNTYWRSHPSLAHPNFSDLTSMRRDVSEHAALSASGTMTPSLDGETWTVTVDVTNLRHPVAFFVRLQLMRSLLAPAAEDARILPAWYQDNYIILRPNEPRQIVIECALEDAGGEWSYHPRLVVSAWNSPPLEANLTFVPPVLPTATGTPAASATLPVNYTFPATHASTSPPAFTATPTPTPTYATSTPTPTQSGGGVSKGAIIAVVVVAVVLSVLACGYAYWKGKRGGVYSFEGHSSECSPIAPTSDGYGTAATDDVSALR